jgi:hypothetical protein
MKRSNPLIGKWVAEAGKKFPLLSSQAFEDAWQHSGVVRCLSAAVMKDGVASWQRRILLPVTIFQSLKKWRWCHAGPARLPLRVTEPGLSIKDTVQ